MKDFCDNNCNECPILQSDNSRMVSFILNSLVEALGMDKVYPIVQAACPNLTCCADCHIDDFCHVENCEIVAAAEDKYGKSTAQPITAVKTPAAPTPEGEICRCEHNEQWVNYKLACFIQDFDHCPSCGKLLLTA